MPTHIDVVLVFAAEMAYREADPGVLERTLRQQASVCASDDPTLIALRRITIHVNQAKTCLAVVDIRYHLQWALEASRDAWAVSAKNPRNREAKPMLKIIRGGRDGEGMRNSVPN